MKKVLIMSFFIAIFSLLKGTPEYTSARAKKPSITLTQWEKLKVGSALLGCAYFSIAAVLDPKVITVEGGNDIDWKHPRTAFKGLTMLPIDFFHKKIHNLSIFTALHLATACSSLLAYLCGTYAIKKLPLYTTPKETDQGPSISPTFKKLKAGKDLGACIFFTLAALMSGKFYRFMVSNHYYADNCGFLLLPSAIMYYLCKIAKLTLGTLSPKLYRGEEYLLDLLPIPSTILACIYGHSLYQQLSNSGKLSSYLQPSTVMDYSKKLLERLKKKFKN